MIDKQLRTVARKHLERVRRNWLKKLGVKLEDWDDDGYVAETLRWLIHACRTDTLTAALVEQGAEAGVLTKNLVQNLKKALSTGNDHAEPERDESIWQGFKALRRHMSGPKRPRAKSFQEHGGLVGLLSHRKGLLRAAKRKTKKKN